MTYTSLIDIPEDVFYSCLLPKLRLNEILRLRRACKWIKKFSEDYLGFHPRSASWLSLDLTCFTCKDEDEPFPSILLEKFLEEDGASTIRMPVNHFRFAFQTLYSVDSNFPQFLTRYAHQIQHLRVSKSSLNSGDPEKVEVEFLDKLPNLRSLCIEEFSIMAPQCLKYPQRSSALGKLRKLEIPNMEQDFDSTLHLIGQCENLDYLRIGKLPDNPEHFKSMCELLEQRKNFKFKFDQPKDQLSLNSIFCKSVGKGDLELVEFDANILLSLEKPQLEQIAPQILSLKNVSPINHRLANTGITFPIVNEVEIYITDVFRGWPPNTILDHRAIESIARRSLSTEIFPALRKLKVRLCARGKETPGLLLSFIWESVPHLEELTFTDTTGLNDHSFLGKSGDCPFVHLKNLTKLDLGDVSFGKITAAVFSKVFRNMRLREFRMVSGTPLVCVTSECIRALLTGPFGETIENFPFSGWSLADLLEKELIQLSRLFPGNQQV